MMFSLLMLLAMLVVMLVVMLVLDCCKFPGERGAEWCNLNTGGVTPTLRGSGYTGGREGWGGDGTSFELYNISSHRL